MQLQSLNPIYVNFDVPQQATAEMQRRTRRCGSRAAISAGVEFHGRITAIDSVVNAETRNIQVQATLAQPEGQLRPGMFVQAEVVLGGRPPGDRAAGIGHQLRAVRRFGLRRRPT